MTTTAPTNKSRRARVFVTLKPGVLDPQGQAVAGALSRLGFSEVKDARVGKVIELDLAEGTSTMELRARLAQMAERLLSNPVIEDFRVECDE